MIYRLAIIVLSTKWVHIGVSVIGGGSYANAIPYPWCGVKKGKKKKKGISGVMMCV